MKGKVGKQRNATKLKAFVLINVKKVGLTFV